MVEYTVKWEIVCDDGRSLREPDHYMHGHHGAPTAIDNLLSTAAQSGGRPQGHTSASVAVPSRMSLDTAMRLHEPAGHRCGGALCNQNVPHEG